MWKQPRSKAGGIRAFFHHWGCGVVALGMPYPWESCITGRGTCTPVALSKTWATFKGRGRVHPTPHQRQTRVPSSGVRELTVSPLPAGQSELFHVLRVEAGGSSGRQGPGDPAAPEGRPAPPELAAGAGGILRQPDRRAGGAAGRQERSHRGACADPLGGLEGGCQPWPALHPPCLLRRSWRRSCRRRRTTRRSRRS